MNNRTTTHVMIYFIASIASMLVVALGFLLELPNKHILVAMGGSFVLAVVLGYIIFWKDI